MASTSRLVWLFALLLLPVSLVSAQDIASTITGTVTNADTGQPVANANVFIANSMNGTVTDAQGNYRLTGVPLGTLQLYVSYVGYEPQNRNLFLRRTDFYREDFQLKEAIVSVGEITVTSDNEKWKRQLEKFITLFIGETPNAQETEITNPEVLDFSSKGGSFTAQASEPLIIENKALGYRIQYFLKDFNATPNRTQYDGEPLFEELSAESPEQQAMWKARRDSAFFGSFRHFMLALLSDRVDEQGFKIFSRPASNDLSTGTSGMRTLQGNQRFPVKRSDILKDGEAEDQKVLEFDGFVEIVYTKEEEAQAYLDWSGRPPGSRPRFRTSLISVDKGPAIVDMKGDVLDPYGVTFYQYLAFERVGDEVPKEYRPWNE